MRLLVLALVLTAACGAPGTISAPISTAAAMGTVPSATEEVTIEWRGLI